MKRPRGRPRKHPPKEPTLPKRGRGRPRKDSGVQEVQEVQGGRALEYPSLPKRGPGRPPKDPTLPKRSPGRPPSDSTSPKRKPGRPPRDPSVPRRNPGGPLGRTGTQSESPASSSSLEPRVLLVPSGEDVAARIFMLSCEEGKAVCVLSANGSVLPPSLSDGVTALPATPHAPHGRAHCHSCWRRRPFAGGHCGLPSARLLHRAGDGTTFSS
ncbi:unnamed protein product [Closterium sp. Yama58-4]|nr:unnamed protein product [Closterium sp. Yama58-4]